MYLNHTSGLRLSLSEITSLFGSSTYLDELSVSELSPRKLSQKVKSYTASLHGRT